VRRRLEGRIQHQLGADALGEHLSRGGSVAEAQHPLAPQIDTRHAQPFGDVLHHQLGGEQRLWSAEAAKRPIRRRIRRNRPRPDADVGQEYAPAAWIAARARTTGVSVQ